MKYKPGQYISDEFNLKTHKDYYDYLFIVKKSIKLGLIHWTEPLIRLAQSQNNVILRNQMLKLSAEDGLNAVRYVTFLNYSLQEYEKVYFVDNDLWKTAKNIKPDNLQLEDIKLPMPCTVLYFKNPVRINNQEISIVMIVDVDKINPDKIVSLAKDAIGKDVYEAKFDDSQFKLDNRIISCFGFEGNNLFKGPALNWTDIFFRHGTVENALTISHNNAMKLGMLNENDSLAQKDFYSHLMSYIAMTMAYDDVEWKTISDKMRKKYCPNQKPQKEIDFLSGVWIGKKKPKTKYEDCDSTGKKLKAHWRSAHWKMQPYGEKNSLRKLTWIDAYLTGKDNDEKN